VNGDDDYFPFSRFRITWLPFCLTGLKPTFARTLMTLSAGSGLRLTHDNLDKLDADQLSFLDDRPLDL